MYAYVITPYEGASASEVEQEVTDPIEAALQELPYIEKLTSKSISGRSEVMVEIQEEYSGGGQTAQIFDELRRQVSENLNAFFRRGWSTIVEDDFVIFMESCMRFRQWILSQTRFMILPKS